MDIIKISETASCEIAEIAKVYFDVGETLDISWVRSQVITHTTESHWETLAREAIRDDLDEEQRSLTANILSERPTTTTCEVNGVTDWLAQRESTLMLWHQSVTALKASGALNYTVFFVITRQLRALARQYES